MPYSLRFGLPIFVSLLAFTACERTEIIEPDAERTFGIRHDRSLADYEQIAAETNPDRPDFGSVVCIVYSEDGDEFVASGVLIDPNWVLTAGHNFYIEGEQDGPAQAATIDVLFGNDPNDPVVVHEVDELVFHPTWISANDDFLNGNDLCLVHLRESVTEFAPTDIYRDNDEAIGELIWFAGFGDYAELVGQDPDLFSRKHAMANILDRKTNGLQTSIDGLNYDGGLLAFDFDHPDGTTNSLGDDFAATDERLLGSGDSSPMCLAYEGTTVQGDSGGPLYALDRSGEWRVAGILSGGANEPLAYDTEDGSYGDISVYIRLANLTSWIDSVIE